MYRAILSAQIKPNAAKLIGRRFTVQMDSDPKHTAKETQAFLKKKKWDIQVSHLISIQLRPSRVSQGTKQHLVAMFVCPVTFERLKMLNPLN